MSAWLISSSVHSRTLIVVAALGLLILGAIEVRNKPLEVIPELALPAIIAVAHWMATHPRVPAAA